MAIANREDGVSITQDDVQLDFAPVSALDARGNHVTIQVRPREQEIVIEAGDSDTVFPVAIELVLSQSLPSMARGAGLGLSVVMHAMRRPPWSGHCNLVWDSMPPIFFESLTTTLWHNPRFSCHFHSD